MTEVPAPGVYLNLPDEIYFGCGAIGSTDLKTLLRSPADWWYGSSHNPDGEKEYNPAFDFGKALHAMILEGEDAYDRVAVISPYPDFRKKEAQEWRDAMVASGRAIISKSEEKAMRHMAALVTNHPQVGLSKNFLREVAVIWEENGVLMRAKFDAINPVFGLDLKSYGGANTQGRSPYDSCMRFIAMRDYDIQRAHYHTAREKMRRFIQDGQVFGQTPEQQPILDEIAFRDKWAWVWLFYQKVDHKAGHAPIVMPIAVMPEDASHRSGRQKIETAMTNYNGYVKTFGLDTPWAQINPLTWAEDHDFMPWMSDVAAPQFRIESQTNEQ
jgi:hypothetical protein